MTRALKQFMKLKKGYCARQECECRTIAAWRDYENHPEYCWCGDEWNPVPPTPTTYTVKFQSNNNSYGTVSPKKVEVEPGTSITIEDNEITIGEETIIATAEMWYKLAHWHVRWGGDVPATVTEDMTIVATFIEWVPADWIDEPSETELTIQEGLWTEDVTFTYSPENATNILWYVDVSSDDEDIAKILIKDFADWVATLRITWEGYGSTTLRITYWEARYTIDVTVTRAP